MNRPALAHPGSAEPVSCRRTLGTWMRRCRHAGIGLALLSLSGCGGGGELVQTPSGACTGQSPLAPTTAQYQNLAGVAANLQSLDVHAPPGGDACPPAPAVVYFHGGGYVTGDKANNVRDKARLFAAQGWTFISVNYRLSPSPVELGNPARVRYPDAQHDAASALAWVRSQAGRLRIDPARIMVMGHSAGGHLVSLVSADDRFLQARGLTRAAITCTVALDTEAYDVLALVQSGRDNQGLYQNAIGTDAPTLEAASPIRHVSAGVAPHFVVTRGPAQRRAQAAAYVAALQRAPSDSELLVAMGYTHEEVNSAVGAPGETLITQPLMTFLHRCAR